LLFIFDGDFSYKGDLREETLVIGKFDNDLLREFNNVNLRFF
jgi:hypothetical protein